MKGKAILTCILLICLLPGTLGLAEIILPSYYSDTYYAELPAMYERLNTVEGPKILVVGGSNVAFGLDGALLEELLAQKGYDYTVCPFGLYAAVGTSAMLDLSADALNEGDIVILAMEPTSETMSGYFGATAFLKCTEAAPEMIFSVGKEKRSALVGNFIPYLQERCAIYQNGNAPVAQGVYAKSSFNERCDMVYDRQGNAMALGFDTASPIDLEAVTVSEDFAKQVNDYYIEALRKGARVYFSFSPMNRSALVDGSEEVIHRYFSLCKETFRCPIISDPNNYILDSDWFYDNNFHLNSAGSTIRTIQLANDVLSQLGCYAALDYTLPEMPDAVYQATAERLDTSFFTFQPLDQEGITIGYLIDGLTEAGETQQSLTVPNTYLELPVVGFTADALAHAASLIELTVPESVESLPEGLFRNTGKLTRLVLEHKTNPCAITEHTFDDAEQLRIYVPSTAYPYYRDGYGCENNPWASYLDWIFPYG